MLKKSEIIDPSGFSLIELMIVMAIIAILSSTAAPYYASVQTKSKRAEMIQSLGGIYTAQNAYFTQTNDWVQSCTPAASCDCTGGTSPTSPNFAIVGFNLASPGKFYGFCMDNSLLPASFLGRAVGNIDKDPTLDTGDISANAREVVIISDDVMN